ncbi:MAG: glycosyltransferase family 1 protein, partial [Acidobacteriota bacterium]
MTRSTERPVRIALDVSKAAGRDGLGTYTRGLVTAVAGLAALPPEADERAAEYVLVNLLGADRAPALAEALGAALGGPPPECFRMELEPLKELTAPEQEGLFGDVDALLATSWCLPAAAPPSLFVVYDLTFFSHPQCHTLGNRLHCAEGLLRARLRGSTLAAISEASAAELRRHLGGQPGRVVIAPPGLGDAFAPADSAAERVASRHGLKDGYVLSVGSFEPRKNLVRLVEAHRLLPIDIRRAFPLILVGGGGWRQDGLERRLAEDDPRAVRRLGAVSEAELVDLFSAATVFVYPSLAEGFGLPVLEAMACGAPVITSNLS